MIHTLRVLLLGFLTLACSALALESSSRQGSSPANIDKQLINNGNLSKLAFSSDGKTLAGLGGAGQIVLWESASGSKRATLSSQTGVALAGLAFDPASSTLVAAGVDPRIFLWDAASGEERSALSGRVGSNIASLVFSPDGRTLASAGGDPWITLWNTSTGQTIQTLAGHADTVNTVAFSPDGALLASGSEDQQIKLWDVRNGQEHLNLLRKNSVSITGLAFSPDGKSLVSVDKADHVVLWDTETGKERLTIQGPLGLSVTGVIFSPDGKNLAGGSRDTGIWLWNVRTGQKLFDSKAQTDGAINKVLFSPNGAFLAGVTQNNRILVWDALTGILNQAMDGQIDFAFSPDGRIIAGINQINEIKIWDLSPNTQRFTARSVVLSPLTGSGQDGLTLANNQLNSTQSALTDSPTVNQTGTPNGIAQITGTIGSNRVSTVTNQQVRKYAWKGITALAISPDGKLFASAGNDGRVQLWDPANGRKLRSLSTHRSAVTGVAFSSDGKRLISVGRDTEIHASDAATGQLGQILQGHEHPIRTVAASPDGRFFASAGEETRIMLWDASTNKLSKIFNGHIDFVNGLAFSSDGKLLASAGADGRVLIWDVATNKPIRTLQGHSGAVNKVVFNSTGKLLASVGQDGRVIIWQVATGQPAEVFQGHKGAVRAVAFSRDGQTLASAGEDAQVMLVDVKSGKLRKSLGGSANSINAVAFGPDGTSLVTGGEDNQIVDWDIAKGTKRRAILVVPESMPAQLPEPQSSIRSGYPPLAGVARGSDALSARGLLDRLLDWFIPSAEAAVPSPPGGPILVLTSATAAYSQYYTEILRNEGFNAFAVADISAVSSGMLAAYDVAILAPAPLTAGQVTTLTNWVNAGGDLIAMRPTSELASLLGLSPAGSTLSEGYLSVNTSQAPGAGIVGQTMQFHGTADRYTLNGATSLATLYSNSTTATTYPALTLRSVGANGGQAAAFAYDLATSIVYTRQGNPAWATQERDGFAPIRSDDKYYGASITDPQLDWIDLSKVAIPQADEQQRLLANLILEMNRDKKPLPRFWYFPRGEKAVVIMTGDDHANNGTAGRFDQFIASSPAGCSVENWECVRGTSYIFPNTPLTNSQAASYHAAGFEVGLHINTNCADYTPASLETFYSQQISTWTAKYSSIPPPITQRHHCIAWSDWATGAKVQLNHGIRLDTSYYFWPPSWVANVPGIFTGSAMPMRFADLDGALIDVYHAATQMTDESGQQYPNTVDTLLDRALGAEGYYGVYTVNAHTDIAQIPEADRKSVV